MPMLTRRRCLTKARLDQDGQSLVIVALALFMVIAIAGFAIDLAGWYQKHHQAQVSADAAALAAANCLANSGSGATCTSTADTTHASLQATTIANSNNIPASSISYGNSQVTVTTATSVGITFAGIIGLGSPSVSARAVATWAAPTTSTACTPTAKAQNRCGVVFAKDTTCSGPNGVNISGGSGTLNGAVWSNANFDYSGGTYTFNGPVAYSSATGCTSSQPPNGATFNDGVPAAQAPVSSWPVDYSSSQYFPACSGTGSAPTNCTTSAANGVAGTPNYCAHATRANNPTIGTGDTGVWCLVGNTPTPANPATYTGTATFNAQSGSYTFTILGGGVTISGGSASYAAASNNLLVYATASDAFHISGGSPTITGDLFAPNGSINISGTSGTTMSTFLEGKDVVLSGGTLSGDGPTSTGSGTAIPGSDSLTQ